MSKTKNEYLATYLPEKELYLKAAIKKMAEENGFDSLNPMIRKILREAVDKWQKNKNKRKGK